MIETITKKLFELGLTVGKPIIPIANYVQTKRVDSELYVSGQLPVQEGVIVYKGKVGEDIDIETAKSAAELCTLNIVNQLIFSLDDDITKIKSCVRLEIFINCSSNFERHSEIANSASNLLIKILGEKGKHTRVTVGVNSLPLNSPVEITSIFEIKTEKE